MLNSAIHLNPRRRTSATTILGLSWPEAVATLSLVVGSGMAHPNSFDCLIEANQTIEVRSVVEGLISNVPINRGDTVRRGQVIVEMNADLERATMELAKYKISMAGRLAAAQSRVEFSARKFERAQELHAEQVVSEQAVDEAKAERRQATAEYKDAIENIELAKLEYRRASEQLNQKIIRSPFDGYVVERNMHPGDLAEPGGSKKPILKLAQINPMRVEAVLPHRFYGRIRQSSLASVKPEGFAASFEAKVAVIDRTIDAASGTFGVRLFLANPKGEIPSGLRCTVIFPGIDATLK